MEATEALQHILDQKGDPKKFRYRPRGFVDWKFGEVAEYLGYRDALEYVKTMRRWYNYGEHYEGKCLLDMSYETFLEALNKNHSSLKHS